MDRTLVKGWIRLCGLRDMVIDQFVLECATSRPGELRVVGEALGERKLGLGCVNPCTVEVNGTASIVARIEEALQHYRPEQMPLNPDCGFGCFASLCVNDEAHAVAKLHSVVAAARTLRARYG